MFDVYWTDPNRELVGERRARKEAQKENSTAVRLSGGSSRSSDMSSDKTFGFFASRKKHALSSKHSKSPTPTIMSAVSNRSRQSFLGIRRSVDDDAASCLNFAQQRSSAVLVTPVQSPGETPPSPSSRESVFSKWTDPSLATSVSTPESSMIESTSKSSVFQPLGSSSFITQSTEITVCPRVSDCGVEDYTASEVTITLDAKQDEPPTPPRSPASFISRADTPVHLVPGSRTPIRSPSSPAWISSFKPNNPDAWKPPQAWDCSPSPELRPSLADIREHDDSPSESTRRLDEMCQVVQRMAATGPGDIVGRLKEISALPDSPESCHRSDMERKTWMLSCLDNLDPVVEYYSEYPSSSRVISSGANMGTKILALYESQATTSYLAAIHPNREICHLSPNPLSPSPFPNVRPLFIPILSPALFPVAPNLFETVYSLSLPSLCSSPDIPIILRNVHRALTPGGIFRLTIIDPTPCPATLGPCMRAWLDERLLLNLERKFRCVHPSKLFPIWLADARLRGEGSTITTAKFAAVPPELDIDRNLMTEDPTLAAKVARAELRTLIGRMLWHEVWGPVVDTDRWWWEDLDCLAECKELGTFWEYSLVEAVKDGAPEL